jgi:hypothetical protein
VRGHYKGQSEASQFGGHRSMLATLREAGV